jgi:hypothetical protein
MFMNRKALIAGAVGLLPASLACADTLTANFYYDQTQNVNVTSPSGTGDESAVVFHWTRTDSAGPGIDSSIAPMFTSFCIDIPQGVSPGVDNFYNVMTPAAYGFTPTQTTLLTDLWGTYESSVTNPTASGAFQTAVWELVYDTDHSMTTGTFKVNGGGAVTTLAQSWLDAITAPGFVYSGPAIDAKVLQSDSVQDQITFVPHVVPTPATAALSLAALGLGLSGRKRR